MLRFTLRTANSTTWFATANEALAAPGRLAADHPGSRIIKERPGGGIWTFRDYEALVPADYTGPSEAIAVVQLASGLTTQEG